jgi:hypothetical protein
MTRPGRWTGSCRTFAPERWGLSLELSEAIGRSCPLTIASLGSERPSTIENLERGKADGDAGGSEKHDGEVVEEHGEGFRVGWGCSPRTSEEPPTSRPTPCGCDTLRGVFLDSAVFGSSTGFRGGIVEKRSARGRSLGLEKKLREFGSFWPRGRFLMSCRWAAGLDSNPEGHPSTWKSLL